MNVKGIRKKITAKKHPAFSNFSEVSGRQHGDVEVQVASRQHLPVALLFVGQPQQDVVSDGGGDEPRMNARSASGAA